MQKILPIVAIVVTVLSIIIKGIRTSKQNALAGKLAELLMNKKYKEFDELINSDETNKTLPAFNITFLKLNEAIIQNNDKKVASVLADEKIAKFANSDKNLVYQKAFFYYINKKDKDNTTKYYELLKEMNSKDLMSIDRMYDTYIKDGYEYLDITLSQLDKAETDEEKIQLYLLISNMYANKKDDENVNKYLKMAEELVNKK